MCVVSACDGQMYCEPPEYVQYRLPSPPSSVNSSGGMPRPSSSTVHAPRAKSTEASTLAALASSEFLSSSSTTSVSDTIAVEDLIWATTSSGRGRMRVEGFWGVYVWLMTPRWSQVW